ncbi:MAG: hypothetical protein GF390_02560 [Candidatus Pacebacteria bacterium]|nr:hypothetical protein [Candidatus Paceibacterota bacterium]
MANKPLYVYIDEGGDFNFTPSGSKVYTITAVITHAPWESLDEISALRHRILTGELHPQLSQTYLENCLCHKFHATEDKQVVRDDFFEIIGNMEYIKAHGIVIKKNLANPSFRKPSRFYSKVASSLLDYIFKRYQYSMLCIFVDNIPVSKQKKVFLKAMKAEINAKQPRKDYAIFFPPSASNPYLQISDYINWAIFRKWERDDKRSYKLIEDLLGKKELDMFSRGDGYEYYQFNKRK